MKTNAYTHRLISKSKLHKSQFSYRLNENTRHILVIRKIIQMDTDVTA